MTDNTQIDSLEQMRQSWSRLEFKIDRLEERNRRLIARLSSERATGRQSRLANYYLNAGIVSTILLPALGMLVWYVDLVPLWYALLYSACGIVLGVSNIFFSSYIRGCNYCEVPTVKAIEHARRVVRSQHRRLIAGIIIVIPVIIPLLYFCFNDENYSALFGAIIGGVVGGLIGYMIHRRKVRLARRIVDDLSDDSESAE